MRFKVGQRAWELDTNHRVYRRDDKGRSYGSPIVGEYYRPRWIVGIEGRSYLVSYWRDSQNPRKVGFAKADRIFLTDAEKDDAAFVGGHRHRIADRVRDADAATLRRVAELIGYEPGEV